MTHHQYSTNCIPRNVLVWAGWSLLLVLASPVASQEECQCEWKRSGNVLIPKRSQVDTAKVDTVEVNKVQIPPWSIRNDPFVEPNVPFNPDAIVFTFEGGSNETMALNPDRLVLRAGLNAKPRDDTMTAVLGGSIDGIGVLGRSKTLTGVVGSSREGTGIAAQGVMGPGLVASSRDSVAINARSERESGIFVRSDRGSAIDAEGAIGVDASGFLGASVGIDAGIGVRAKGILRGVEASSTEGIGVSGESKSSVGVVGQSETGTAIRAISESGDLIVGENGLSSPVQFRVDNSGEIFSMGVLIQSDVSGKTEITPLTDVLPKLGQIRGISFRRSYPDGPQRGAQERRLIGVVAQEVEAAFPEVVTDWGDGDRKAVDYGGLTAVLIEAVKGLRFENEELRARLAALEQRIAGGEAGKE
jgi:Chaperone of endosialidase